MNHRIFRYFCVAILLLCATIQPLAAQIASLSDPASETSFLPGDFDNASTTNPLIGSFSFFPPVLPISGPEESFSEGPFLSFAGISAVGTPLVWTTKAPMPAGRWCPGVAAAPNGKVYAMGGVIHTSVNVTRVDEYDPISNTWATRSPMPWAHHVWAVTAHNGKIYSVGGTTYGRDWYSRVDEYNPGNDTWTTKNPMPTARYHHGLAIANNGKIYAIGGDVNRGNRSRTQTRSVEEYDPDTNTWQIKAQMPTAREALTAVGAADGLVYAIGGFNGSIVLNTVEAYDPTTNTWMTKSPMPTPRMGMMAVAAPDGKIYACGGWAGPGWAASGPLVTVEAYDPTTNTWEFQAPMPNAYGFGGATLCNGKIYVMGGEKSGGGAVDKVDEATLNNIISVEAIPKTLWVDKTGAGSGIVFRATTSAATTVSFKVRPPAGPDILIGSKITTPIGTEHVAKLSWWGNSSLVSGTYTIIATAGGSSKQTTFTVNKIDQTVVGMGTWLKHTKDPGVQIPPRPNVNFCPIRTWEELIGEKEGFSRGITLSDPVNIVSGNFVLPEEDLTIKSRFPLVLARIYNSLDPNIGAFGRGWSSPFLTRLEFLATDVVFINSDGSRILFNKTGSAFQAPEWSDLRLVFDTNTSFWTISHPNGAEWTFNTNGKIIRMSRACCGMGATDALLFDYDSNGRLIRVTNPVAQYIQFSYNSDNRIVTAVDSAGRTLLYSYSSEGNLASFTDAVGQITTYGYLEDGFLNSIVKTGNRTISITYVDRRVSIVTNPDGTTAQFAWNFVNPKLNLTDLNGTVHEYGFTPDWQFNSYAVSALGIAKNFISSGSALIGYTNTLGNSSTYAYRTDGLLQSITDVMGNSTTYEWHPTFHRLTKKTDSLGRNWRYSWCSRGNLVEEIDPAGGIASFGFDDHNNRTSRTDQLGRVQRWVYDGSSNYLLQAIDPEGGISSFSYDNRGNLIAASDQLGRTTQFQFDILDRLTKTIYADGRFAEMVYDEAGNITLRRDNLGRETRYSFDLANRLTTLTRPDGTTFNYAYNPVGQKISETDTLDRVTRFEYSPIGLLTKTTFADGAFETFSYDTESRLVSKTNELGQTSSLVYDALGRLLATIDPTGARWESQFDSVGRKSADKDPLNRVTAYQFDVLDRVTKVTRPDSSFVSNSFDSVGNLLSTGDALGNNWSWVYDNLNRQVKAILPNGASSTTSFDAAGQVVSETDALNRITRYAFDLGGRRTATTDALGNIWQNFYDNAGRLTAVKDPLGAGSSMVYDTMDRVISQLDPLGNSVSFEFDATGRRVAKTDAMGRRSITAYDLRDRVTSEVDPEGHTVSYGYNLAGQRVSLTDGANRTWRWEFDSLGRVISDIDQLGNINRYAFDSVGNRTSLTNARNQTTTSLFDLMNRLSQVNYPDGTLATVTYDLEGRELSRSGPTGSVVKTWDSVGNVISETFGPWGKKWQYSFDLAGNRISAIDPEGGVYKYSPDKLNRLVQLDPPGHDNVISNSFDAAGHLIGEARPGVKTTNTFDLAGRLLELRHERNQGSKKLVASREYTYSPVGNRLSMQDENGAITKYFYNNSDWLIQSAYPDGQRVNWTYNGAGDRIAETTETPTSEGTGRNAHPATITVVLNFGYDLGGRMVSRASDTFQYDNNGNLVSAIENGETTNNTWSSDNRLIQVSKDILCEKHGTRHCFKCKTMTISESYAYEPLNWRRLTRKTDDQTFVSVFDHDDESHEYLLKTSRDDDDHGKKDNDKNDTKPRLKLVREFVGGPGTDDLVATKYHGRTLETLKDGLGSTIALTNRGGNAVTRVNYDAWGNLRYPDKPGYGVKPCRDDELDSVLDRLEGKYAFGDADHDSWWYGKHHSKNLNPYLFTGRRFDSFSGLYNNRNRQYAPKVGRFISRDPIGFNGGLNLFGYAKNNPVLETDPSGNSALIYIGGPVLLLAVGYVAYIEIRICRGIQEARQRAFDNNNLAKLFNKCKHYCPVNFLINPCRLS